MFSLAEKKSTEEVFLPWFLLLYIKKFLFLKIVGDECFAFISPFNWLVYLNIKKKNWRFVLFSGDYYLVNQFFKEFRILK